MTALANPRTGPVPAEYDFANFRTAVDSASGDLPGIGTPRTVRSWAGLALAGALAGTSAGDMQTGPFASLASLGTTDVSAYAPRSTADVVSDGDLVQRPVLRSDQEETVWLKQHSGLTWEQLGKVFGVSRRAVHMWANGGRLNEANAQRLREFTAVVANIESRVAGPMPEGVRAALMRLDQDGLSTLDRLKCQEIGASWGAPFGPEHLVNATREPLRKPVGGTEG
jgi:hypothetical protein